MSRFVGTGKRWAWVAVVLLVVVFPAYATDGVLHINQACAVNTGCFAGDSPGFPVTIENAGGYRLTGDLAASGGANGIEINAEDVSLDLNGFRITGGGTGTGVHVMADNAEIRGGTISSFADGIGAGSEAGTGIEGTSVIGVRLVGNNATGAAFAGSATMISGCMIRNNEGNGLRFFGIGGMSAAVDHTQVMANGRFGIEATNGAMVTLSSNKVMGNASNDLSANYGGSFMELGVNQCGSGTICLP